MNRIPGITIGRLSARAAIITGSALGLVAGVTVYGAVSSSAQSPSAFKAANTAQPAVAAAPLQYANCAKGAKLEKGFCVTHVVKMVVATPTAGAAAKAKAAPVAGAKPAATVKPAPVLKQVIVATLTPAKVISPVAAAAPLAATPAQPAATATKVPAPAPEPTSTAKPTATASPSAPS